MNQVITANRLTDGAVVFLGTDRAWGERLDRAAMYDGKEAVATALEQAKQDEENNLVVDVYAIDVSANSGAVVPTKLRELIRARGPTIHPEFTKAGSVPPTAQEDDHVSV
jgi:hypothetical protein